MVNTQEIHNKRSADSGARADDEAKHSCEDKQDRVDTARGERGTQNRSCVMMIILLYDKGTMCYHDNIII